MRLADSLGLDQEAGAKRMGISKPTFCRVLAEARKAVATALYQGHALRIAGGSYYIDGEDGLSAPLDGQTKSCDCPQECSCSSKKEKEEE